MKDKDNLLEVCDICPSLIDHFKEAHDYKKYKVCCSCKNFLFGLGSSGFCKYGPGGCAGMIDCMDTCYYPEKYKYDYSADVKHFYYKFLFKVVFPIKHFIHSITYKKNKVILENNCNKSNDDDSETLYF